MSGTRSLPARLAWPLFAMSALLMLVGYYLETQTRGSLQGGIVEQSLMAFAFLSLPAVGALIACRYPRNAIGWLLLWIGFAAGLIVFSMSYAAMFVPGNPDPGPLAVLSAWFEQWLWFPIIGPIPTLLLLLFPTGRLPSRRWRWVLWGALLLLAVITVPAMVEERLTGEGYSIPNPLGIDGVADVEDELEPLFVFGFAPVVLLSVVSLIFRYRGAKGEERQQLKWFALSGILMATGIAVGDVVGLPDILFPLLLMTMPASIAVAVLKYRLYDIDVVVNRTLVYGSLTAILAASYFGLVALLQIVLAPATEGSDIAVVASTLAVAALFRPVLRRVQAFVDRRFYRRKYDAERTLEVFSSHLREQVDIDSLSRQLVAVVGDTMQPAHASVWLRGEAR